MKIERNNYEVFFLDYFENTLAAEKVAELFLFLENNPDLKKEFEHYSSTILPSPIKSVYTNKDSLKKPVVDENNIEDFMLRSIDAELSKDEEVGLENFLKSNPIAKKEYDLLCKTKLRSPSIFYANKLNLRKKGIDHHNYQTYLIADLEGELDTKQQEDLSRFLALYPDLKNDKKLLSQTILQAERIEFPDKSSLKKAVPLFSYSYKYLSVAVAACALLLFGVWFYNPENADNPDIADQLKVENIEQNTRESNDKLLSEKETSTNIDPVNDSDERLIIDPLIDINKEAITPSQWSANKTETIASQSLLVCDKIDFDLPIGNTIEHSSRTPESITYSEPDTELLAIINEFYNDSHNSNTNQDDTQLASLARRNLTRLSDDSYVASTVLDKDKKSGRKLFDLVATGVSKISKDKMMLNGRFNDQDKLVAYQLQSNKINLKNKY